MASERFTERMADRQVSHDTRVMGDFVSIWCDARHRDRERARAATDAAKLGVYGRKVPILCDECVAHLAYAEKRRAYCPKSPKPFCAHCDSQCYSAGEQVWQRTMMRFSGPRSLLKGHAIDGLKHALEARRYARQASSRAAAADEKETS